ncbi:MAG: glycosyl hydrolase family 18 protein [bacterium]|nr:glycosyl hydrolase family 18 protein [bacterium]
MRKLFLGGLLLLLLAGVAAGWWFWEAPILSPLTSSSSFRFLVGPDPSRTSGKIVYGFLPFWNVTKTTLQPELTHLGYFSLTVDGDGSIITQQDGGTEPGYGRLQSESFLEVMAAAEKTNANLELVITQFENDDIIALLSSKQAQSTLISEIDAVLLAYPFTGVNIDIEFTGEVTPTLRQNLVEFMSELNTHLDSKYTNMNLSIDMYSSAATRDTLWDVAEINRYVDYIIIMAYDFHFRGSSQAGPVAPLFGGKELWDSDISTHLKAYTQLVPSKKLILGVPFYGYSWQTTSDDSQANTFPRTGSTASFDRVQQLLLDPAILNVQQKWNEKALSPYITYEEDGETYVLYYENSRSLSYKLDYVNQLNLGGIAIWALGYEGTSRELWDVISSKM